MLETPSQSAVGLKERPNLSATLSTQSERPYFDFYLSDDWSVLNKYDDIFLGTEPGMSGTAESFLGLAHGRIEVTPGGQENEELFILSTPRGSVRKIRVGRSDYIFIQPSGISHGVGKSRISPVWGLRAGVMT